MLKFSFIIYYYLNFISFNLIFIEIIGLKNTEIDDVSRFKNREIWKCLDFKMRPRCDKK